MKEVRLVVGGGPDVELVALDEVILLRSKQRLQIREQIGRVEEIEAVRLFCLYPGVIGHVEGS